MRLAIKNSKMPRHVGAWVGLAAILIGVTPFPSQIHPHLSTAETCGFPARSASGGLFQTRFRPVLLLRSDRLGPSTWSRGCLLLTHTETSPSDAFEHDCRDSTRCLHALPLPLSRSVQKPKHFLPGTVGHLWHILPQSPRMRDSCPPLPRLRRRSPGGALRGRHMRNVR